MYKYLRITIYDNDFYHELKVVAEHIINMNNWISTHLDVSDKDLDKLKLTIQHMLYASYSYIRILKGRDIGTDFSYFLPHISIVDAKDIPVDDNVECVYIPLFKSNKYLIQ